jgi:NADH-quinone oxidoreductase subunit E
MARLTPDNEVLARQMIGRYPRPKSALIPLLHLAQQQDGYLTDEAMEHVAELVGCTAAEVLGTASFYEMLKLEPVGTYVVNVCTDISCMLLGADQLLHHAESHLGIRSGQTTADGAITLEGVMCIAACTEAPCLQANYRYRYRLTNETLTEFLDDLRDGKVTDVPVHGVLARTRQEIPAGRAAGPADPDEAVEPVWMGRGAEPDNGAGS